MKLKVALVLMFSMIFALGLAGIASAQSRCDSFTFTNGSAPPGGSDTVCGTDLANTNVVMYYDGAVANIPLGDAVTNENGEFCITFTVPIDATVGDQVFSFVFSPDGASCPSAYVVEAAVPTPPAEVPVPVAAPATEVPVAANLPVTLPSTGFMLIPAGGLLAGGLGTLLFGKRRR